ncbi:MAG: hypothetical protein OHK0017_01440 [Patescibacteria group bacterium]
MNYAVFDIETQNWFSNLPSGATHADLKVSILGAYFSKDDIYLAFQEKDLEEFVEKLKQVDLVVGYNSVGFDYPVLQAYTNLDLQSLPSYDIMLEIEKKVGFKVRLGDVAAATLGYGKTDKGSNAVDYYKQGVWDKLIDYCMYDVKITKEVFEVIVKEGKVKYKDLIDMKEVILDPVQVPDTKQLRYFEQGIF